jgi:predicted CxxxxCH...CXXCH cytochrome family protein
MDDPRNRALVALVALVAATSACAGTLEDPERFIAALGVGDAGLADESQPPPASDGAVAGNCPDIPGLFAQTCTAASCHSASTKSQGLDLQSPNLAARLVGAPATEGPGLLIDPSAPSQSILYEKLTANPPFGARMPLAATPLDDATMACVLAWITRQASSAGSSEGGASEDSGAADATSD